MTLSLAAWQFLPNAAGRRTLLASMTEAPRAPVPTSKIAAFDLDDTLISKRSGALCDERLPTELQRLVADSFTIVILSNQLFVDAERKQTSKQEKDQRVFLHDTPKRVAQLDVPFYIYAAKERDYFRKPMPGMIEKHLEMYNVGEALHPDSFFVGDAAGRKGDHNDSDRKMALSVPMKFYTPQEFMTRSTLKKPQPFSLRWLDVSRLAKLPPLPHGFEPSGPPEVVLLVGLPGSGKTTFWEQVMAPHGYIHVTSLARPFQFQSDKRYAVELPALRTKMQRDVVLNLAKNAGLAARLLRIEPPDSSANGAWRQLVWRHYCEPSTPSSQMPSSRSDRTDPEKKAKTAVPGSTPLSAESFAKDCSSFTCPHPESKEAANYHHGVQEVEWSYRGPPEQRDRFFRMWAETGEEKNKVLSGIM